MQKVLILKSTGGSFEIGFGFTLSIANENATIDIEELGILPPSLSLEQDYIHWKTAYLNLGLRSRLFTSAKAVRKTSPLKDCRETSTRLESEFNLWLRSDSFLPIREMILSEINRHDQIRIVIQVDHLILQQLPWSLWDILQRYPQAEVAIASPTFQRSKINNLNNPNGHSQVKILAILGDSSGIDIERDRSLLQALPNADVTFLVEPKRQDLADQLWEQSWDILFFAGHSVTQKDQGYFYLNAIDRLSIDDLKYVLKRAVDRGLSLGIFNSCDGFGLARALADVQIPQTIFMREPVPDRVAQLFLNYFLASFSQGQSLYLAVRNARERLKTLETSGIQDNCQDLENDPIVSELDIKLDAKSDGIAFGMFPCASWLPLIFQNLAQRPPTWESFTQSENLIPTLNSTANSITNPTINSIAEPTLKPTLKPIGKWATAGMIALSLVVAAGVVKVRSQGWLQGWELKGYDHLINVRSGFKLDAVDQRLLVVTIDDEDAAMYKVPKDDLSVSDRDLVKLLIKLRQANAKVIGVDLVRNSKGVDPKLVRSLQGMSNVVGNCAHKTSDSSGMVLAQGFENNAGFVDMAQDSPDSTIRRHLLKFPLDPDSPCQLSSSFGLALATQFLGQTSETVIKQLPIMVGNNNSGPYQNSDDRDDLDLVPHVLINYRNAKIRSISMSDFMNDRGGKLDLKNKIVLIGTIRANSTDRHSVPMVKPVSHGTSRETGNQTAGVWIQAEKAGFLVSLVKGERSAIWIMSDRWVILCIGLGAISGSVAVWNRNLKLRIFIVSGLWLIVYGSSCFVFIQFSAWTPLIPILIAVGVAASVTSIYYALYCRHSNRLHSIHRELS